MAWEDTGRAVWHHGPCGDDADPHDGSDHAHRNLSVDFARLCSIEGGTTLGSPTDQVKQTMPLLPRTHKQQGPFQELSPGLRAP